MKNMEGNTPLGKRSHPPAQKGSKLRPGLVGNDGAGRTMEDMLGEPALGGHASQAGGHPETAFHH